MWIEAGALELDACESSEEQNDAIFLLLVYTQYWFIRNVLIMNDSVILSNLKRKERNCGLLSAISLHSHF